MRKKEIITAISKMIEMPQYQVEMVIDTLPEVVTLGLLEDGEVILRGLFSLKLGDLRSRHGYNIKTGKKQDFAPRRKVKFKLAKPIEDSIQFE